MMRSSLLTLFSGGSGPSSPAPGVQLDAPISSSLASISQLAFGFDLLVEGYTGDTVRLKRLSDNAESDFGTLSGGSFDKAAVNTWRSGADVDLVKRYDQMGTGKEEVAVGTVAVVRSDAWTCFGDSWDPDTGLLSLSATDGAGGARIESGGYTQVPTSGITTANGLEIHVVFAPFTRKKANTSTEPSELNGNSTPESVIAYGASGNTFQYIIGNAGNTHYVERNGSGASGGLQTANSGGVIKANSLGVTSILCDNTNISHYDGNGRRSANALTATANSVDNRTANGSMTNGTLRIGASLTGTNPGNFLLGPVIVTQTLTDIQRFDLHYKLGVVAHQHLWLSDVDLFTLLGGENAAVIDWSHYSDAVTGDIEERHGHFSIAWNTGTVGGTTPNLDFAATVPIWGLQGVQRIGESCWANAFMASNNWGSDKLKFSAIHIGYRTAGGHLAFWWSDGDPATWPKPSSGTNDKWSRGQGYHHSQPTFYGRVNATVDTTSFTNALPWADDVGGKLGQAIGKYCLAVPNGSIDNRESVAITGVYLTNPVVVSCPTHGRSTNAKVWISDVGGTVELNEAEHTIINSRTLSAVDTGADTVTSTAHGIPTGVGVTYTSSDGVAGAIGGLTHGGTSYVRAVDADTIALYDTAAHAIAGGATGLRDLTSSGTGTHTLTMRNEFIIAGVNATGFGAYTSGGAIYYTTNAEYTFNGHTYPAGTKVTWALLLAWINTTPTTPENRLYHNWTAKYPFDANYLEIQIGTTDPNSTYDPENPVQSAMRTGTRWNYAAPLIGRGFGHLDQSIANQTESGSISHALPEARIQTNPYLNMIDGYDIMTIIRPDYVFTLSDARKIRLNLPRFLRNGWGDVAPAFTGTPTISGTQEVDRTMTVDITGLFTGNPTPTATFNLQRDTGGDLSFSTIDTQTGGLVASRVGASADQGNKLRWYIQLHSVAGDDDIYTDPTGLIGASTAPPSNTVAPTLSGTMRGGESITVGNGTWIGAPTITYTPSLEYADTPDAAEEDWSPISGSGSPYVIPGDNTYQGKYFRPSVNGANAYGTVTAKGAAYGPIAAAPNIQAATLDYRLNEGTGTALVDNKHSGDSSYNGTAGASATWTTAGSLRIASSANSGFSAPAKSEFNTASKWCRTFWLQRYSTITLDTVMAAVGAGNSTTHGNRSYRCIMTNGGTNLTFQTTRASDSVMDTAVTLSNIKFDTARKYLVAIQHDPTGGAGASTNEAAVVWDGIGTVSVTAGSPTITGSGVTFTANDVGRYFMTAGGQEFLITGYTSATILTASANATSNESGAAFRKLQTGNLTTASPMKTNAAWKYQDRDNAAGTGLNHDRFRDTHLNGAVRTRAELWDLHAAGSESGAY